MFKNFEVPLYLRIQLNGNSYKKSNENLGIEVPKYSTQNIWEWHIMALNRASKRDLWHAKPKKKSLAISVDIDLIKNEKVGFCGFG